MIRLRSSDYKSLPHCNLSGIPVQLNLSMSRTLSLLVATLLALPGLLIFFSSTAAHAQSSPHLALGPAATPPQFREMEVFGDGLYTWPADKLPVKVFIRDGADVAGYRPEFTEALRSAFERWIDASKGRLSWREVDREDAADVVCYWRTDVRERINGTEAGLTRTHTRFNTETREGTIVRATMGLLTELPGKRFSGEEFQKICLHEVGHAFGLAGHSHERGDIMYKSVSGVQSRDLTERDCIAINRLYGAYPVRPTQERSLARLLKRENISSVAFER